MDPLKEGNNPKLAGLKEAVKQKLLQAVAEQAVNELAGTEDADLARIVEEFRTSPDADASIASFRDRLLSELVRQSAEEAADDTDHLADWMSQQTSRADELEVLQSDVKERYSEILQERLQGVEIDRESLVANVLAGIDDLDSVVQNAADDLREALRFRIVEDVTRPESMQTVADTAGKDDMLATLSDSIRSKILRRASEKALDDLTDEEAASKEGLAFVPADAQQIGRVESALRDLLLTEIADRTASSISDIDESAEDARVLVENDTETIKAVSDSVYSTIIEEIVASVQDRIEDTDRIATEVAGGFDENNSRVKAAITTVSSRVFDRIKSAVSSAMEDTAVAERISAEISETDDRYLEAIDRTETLLHEAIAEEARQCMADASSISEAARKLIDAEELVPGLESLRDKLVQEIASRTLEQISDTDAVAGSSMDHISGDQEELVHARERLKDLLLERMIDHTLAEIRSADAVASEMSSRVDNGNSAMQKAREILRERLMERLFSEAIQELAGSVESRSTDNNADFFQSALETVTSFARNGSSDEGRNMEDDAGFEDEGGPAWEDDEQMNSDSAEEISAGSEASELAAEDRPAIQRQRQAPQLEDAVGESVSSDDWVPISELGAGSDSVDSTNPPGTVLPDAIRRLDSEPADDPLIAGVTSQIFETEDDTQSSLEMPVPDLSGPSEPGEVAAQLGRSGKPWTINEFGQALVQSVDPILSIGQSFDTAALRKVSPSPLEKSREDHVLYLYGVIATAEIDALTSYGQIKGVDSRTGIELVTEGDLTVIVSSVSRNEYDQDPLRELMRNTAWLKEHVRRHAEVLSALRDGVTVIPVEFGTTCTDTSAVRTLTKSRAVQFAETLGRLRGKTEYRVRLFCDTDALTDAIRTVQVDESDFSEDLRHQLLDLKKSPAIVSNGSSGELDLADLIATCADTLHRVLDALASEQSLVPVDEHDLSSRELVMDAVYLVSSDSEPDFQASVASETARLAHLGFRVEDNGPWPPYHFAGTGSSNFDSIEGVA